MERVAFLLEQTGDRVGCLLNPSTVVVRRTPGIKSRSTLGGGLAGTALTDDPLIYVGGGRTEVDLDLLFDIGLAGSTIVTDDIRDVTAPLWDLAENTLEWQRSRSPKVRFVWGKAWNLPAVVIAIAERLEAFTASGAPQRSWLRMRLLRVAEQVSRTAAADPGLWQPGGIAGAAAGGVRLHQTLGGRVGETSEGERLDEIANRYYGNPALWKELARYNRSLDPTRVPPGTVVQIPPLTDLLKPQ
jgi:hypothetical protein